MASENNNLVNVEKELESPNMFTSKDLIDLLPFEQTSVPSKITVSPLVIEVTGDSDDSSDSTTPSNVLTTSSQQRRKGRFTITPAADEFWMDKACETPKVFPTPLAAASVHNDTEPLIANEEDSSQYLGSDEPANVVFTSRQNSDESPLVQRRSLLSYYTAYSTYVADSLFIVPVLLLILGLSCLTVYMGIVHLNKCDLMPDLPVLIVLLGSSGIYAYFSRIVYIISKYYGREIFPGCRLLTSAGMFIFVFIFVVEASLFNFTVEDPSTESGSRYCDPIFYNFVYWNNVAVVVILIILAILYVPDSCCKKNEAEASEQLVF